MKRILCITGLSAIFVLAACQMNDIHDTGGGAVAPVSIVTGIKLERSGGNNP